MIKTSAVAGPSLCCLNCLLVQRILIRTTPAPAILASALHHLLLQEIKLQDKHLNQRLTGLWNTGRHCYMLLLIALLLLQVPLPSLPLVLTPFPLPLLLVLLSPLVQPAGSTESTESTRSRSTLIMCPLTITKFIIRP